MASFVLASASPRRRALLESLGLAFTVEPAGVDESATGTITERTMSIATRKAETVARRHATATILAADTMGEHDGVFLGKPSDADDARKTLRRLSGRTHTVVSAVVALRVDGGRITRRAGATSVTRVTFHHLDDATIDAYVATGEPLDKAAAYGIQGAGGAFVAHIDGSWSNVVGLPVDLALRALATVDHPLPAHLRLPPLPRGGGAPAR